MAIASKKLTFAEYLQYDDGTNTRYELVEGELIPMSIGTGRQGAISKYLERIFDAESRRMGQNWTAQRFAVGVRSPRGGRSDTCRIPDITLLPLKQWEELANREAIIELNEPPPILVVEIVSESTRTTDYQNKRWAYAVLGIQEYWLVDPLIEAVTIFTLVSGFYNVVLSQGETIPRSQVFPELELSAAQILSAGT
ncbi:MAG: Uma2 family endonuclease [Cyanobacteria bacterium P01_E01_bin.42]